MREYGDAPRPAATEQWDRLQCILKASGPVALAIDSSKVEEAKRKAQPTSYVGGSQN